MADYKKVKVEAGATILQWQRKLTTIFRRNFAKSAGQLLHSKASLLLSVTVSWVLAKTLGQQDIGVPFGAPFS
jgi:hypothetical protein